MEVALKVVVVNTISAQREEGERNEVCQQPCLETYLLDVSLSEGRHRILLQRSCQLDLKDIP